MINEFSQDIIQQIQQMTGTDPEQATKIMGFYLPIIPMLVSATASTFNVEFEVSLDNRLTEIENQQERISKYLNHFIGLLTRDDQLENSFKAIWDEIAQLKAIELVKGTIKGLKDDELEFYTVTATGECGMSQSTLAKLAGVSDVSLVKLRKTLLTKTPSYYLKAYIGQDFTLLTSDQNILTIDGKNVGNLTLYKADYCAAVITHYAMKENPTALHNLANFCSLGITKWIQGITGWQPQTMN